jgi:hypothetical protein
MSSVSAIVQKVSDMAVGVLPEDGKQALKQISQGNLTGVKHVSARLPA